MIYKFTDATNDTYAFDYTSNIEIAEGVEKIGSFAFPYMKPSKFSLPSSLKEIASCVFEGTNYSTSEVILPADLTKKSYAFAFGGFNFIVPENLNMIEDCAFYGMANSVWLEGPQAGNGRGSNWDSDWSKNYSSTINYGVSYQAE
ncbi:MAG: leucine-rich repeat protein [Clostridia bacterium]|nr:leucine-rich repeat protein [Clostridia bacterium]